MLNKISRIILTGAVFIVMTASAAACGQGSPAPGADAQTEDTAGSTAVTQTQVQSEEDMNTDEIIKNNREFLVRELNLKEDPALGAATQLVSVGCGTIVSISDLDKSGNAYSMTLTDDKGDSYYATMSYEGYLGIVKDSKGNYLIMPID